MCSKALKIVDKKFENCIPRNPYKQKMAAEFQEPFFISAAIVKLLLRLLEC